MNKKLSFTLIEIIIVLGIISLILPAIFSIVFVILRQQTKIIRIQEVKRQGDFALNFIKTKIRQSATAIYDSNNSGSLVCSTSNSNYNGTLYFLDKNEIYFWFILNNKKIISNPENFNITNDKVSVSNFSLTCQRKNLYSPPIINLFFNISYNSNSTRPEEIVPTLSYQTKFKLKNY